MIHCLRAAPRWHAYPTPQIIRSVKLSHHEANATSATGCDGQGASPSEETRCRSDKKLEQGQIVKRRSVSPAAWRRVCLGNREQGGQGRSSRRVSVPIGRYHTGDLNERERGTIRARYGEHGRERPPPGGLRPRTPERTPLSLCLFSVFCSFILLIRTTDNRKQKV